MHASGNGDKGDKRMARYLRLDFLLKRRSDAIPAVLLIDTGVKWYPSVAYHRYTGEALGNNKKIAGKRSLRTFAYVFGSLFDDKGEPIVSKRAITAKAANDFVREVIERAVPISEEEYYSELQRVKWQTTRVSSTLEGEGAGKGAYAEDSLPQILPSHVPTFSMKQAEKLGKGPGASRKALVLELVKIAREMGSEELAELVEFARFLAYEEGEKKEY